MRSGPAAAAGARAPLHACPRLGAPAPVPGRGRSREQDGGAPSRERDKWRESLPEKACLGEVGGYRAGEIRESHRGLVGGLVGAEGGGAPRDINSRPGFDRRVGDWRCRPPSPRGEGRSALSGRGGGGGLDCPVGGGWRPRGRSRGGGWREGGRGPGAGRGRGPPLLPAPGSVSPPSPRRLGGVGGAARAGGSARGGALLFCLLLSQWSGSGSRGGPGSLRTPGQRRRRWRLVRGPAGREGDAAVFPGDAENR